MLGGVSLARAFYVFTWAGSIAVCGAMSGERAGAMRQQGNVLAVHCNDAAYNQL